jgi:hypothetical protein
MLAGRTQIGGVEAFGNPAVDRCEEITGFAVAALLPAEPGDGSVEIVTGGGDSTIAARIDGAALHDLVEFRLRQPRPTHPQLRALVEANLPIVASIVEVKRRRGESRAEGRYGSTIEVLDIGAEDLRDLWSR